MIYGRDGHRVKPKSRHRKTHVEHRPRRAQKLGSEFGVSRQSRALAALALVGQLLQPLREAAVDRLFPCAQINQ